MSDPIARATMAQVAARAGVSVMTASYAYSRPGRVSQASQARVFAAAAELGYAGPDPSARSLRRGSTGTIGIVLGERLSYAFDDPQATSFMAGIAEVCGDRGLGMTILPITGSDDDAARVLAAAVDAFVVWTVADDDPIIDAVLASRRPTVVHGGPLRDGLTVVSIDNRAAARAIGAIAFAWSRRPAVLAFPLDRDRLPDIFRGTDPNAALFPVTRARLQGYRDAALDVGIAWPDVTVAVCSTNDTREAEQLVSRLLAADDRPDSIAAMSDELAAGALRAARKQGGRLPAITGWDDGAVAAEYGITTVTQSLRAQGAASALIALGLEAPPDAEAWSVTVRGSTR